MTTKKNFLTLALIAGLSSSQAFALTTLKQVQVSGGSQIDLLFDGKISKSQIKTEFINDTIQLSLTDTAVYPAKISTISGSQMTKIFAYQYAPKLVRCRLTLKGKASDFQNLLQLNTNGKILTIRLPEVSGAKSSDRVQTTAAAPAHNGGASADFSAPAKKATPEALPKNYNEETALLEKVMKNPAPTNENEPVVAPVKATAEKTAATNTTTGDNFENQPLTQTNAKPLATGKALPNPLSAFGKLALVLGLFGLCVVGAKNFINKQPANSKASNVLAKFGVFGVGGGKKGKLIEMIASHYVGPKKSIAVIRVGQQNFVVGITNDSINLISKLSGEIDESLNDLEVIGETETSTPQVKFSAAASTNSDGPSLFSKLLKQQKYQQTTATPAASAQELNTALQTVMNNPQPGVRSQIKNKLEGLKQL